jgi:HprK-related kinase A
VKVGDLTESQLRRQLARPGIVLGIGPFLVRIATPLRPLATLLHHLYADYPIGPADGVIDFHVRVDGAAGPRRWLRPQARFRVDGRMPLEPIQGHLHLPALEWGLNWCIAARAHFLLMLHAAVVERGGKAILLPAWSGHGKSTLCAALAHSGWRLLCDEFGLVRPGDGALLPLPRLIPLKDQSIGVIRELLPGAVLGPEFPGTRKGTIAHLRPPTDSIARAAETARPGWLVFPRWQAGASLSLEPMARAETFLNVATNAFNYEVLGETAFELVAGLVETCPAYSLTYSDLGEALSALDQLTTHAT